MNGNTFGKAFSCTSFGESHGPAIGVVIDGCLPNMPVDFELINKDLQRRKPGQSKLTTSRNEAEEFEILSGVFEGKTLGTPICIMVRNKDAKSSDYDSLKDIYRPSHADFTYQEKYGIRDHRGGGRQSARETVARVLAGAFAKMILQKLGISIQAYVSQVHTIELNQAYTQLDLDQTESNAIRCPEPNTAKTMMEAIEVAQATGDTLGGTISCVIKHVPIGWGSPVFDKLNADLAKAMFSINAVKGFDLGSGFAGTKLKGSQHNDVFEDNEGTIHTKTNHSGGIQGGISNGEDIYFKVAFKPVASILQPQESVSTSHEAVKFTIAGRHDACVLPRAVPIVEAMAAMVLVDHYLRNAMLNMQPFA
ncbi:MAG: chorismate synthase [Bacteroidetes bacterium B1(2017)]|nr:MAG: chorismate synthase [Bacteroidetes bacterium B1(2017)]